MDVRRIAVYVFDGKRERYPVWERQTLAVLDLDGCGVVLREEGELDEEEVEDGARGGQRAAELRRRRANARVYNLLIISLADHVAARVVTGVDQGDGRALWARIRECYAPDNAQNHASLLAGLLSTRFENFNNDVEAFLNDLNRQLDMLRATGRDTADVERTLIVLVGRQLPVDFYHITHPAAIDEEVNWNDFCESLRLFAVDHPIAPRAQVMAARSNGVFNGICYSCGKRGHRRAECRSGQQRFNRNQGNGRPTAAAAAAEPGAAAPAARGQNPAAAAAPVEKFVFSAKILTAAATATSVDPATALVSRTREFCLDTGASDHIVCDRALFTALTPCSTKVLLANGSTGVAVGAGTVDLAAKDQAGARVPLELDNALFMPEGCMNLLAADRLVNGGCQLLLNGKDPAILLPNGNKVPLIRRDRAFWLPVQPLATALASQPEPSPMLLHERLGHLNEGDMRALGVLAPGEALPFCNSCALAKSKRKAVAKKAAPRETKPGELTHTDMNGPMEVETPSGQRYAIVFVDDATRHMSLMLMRSKDQALEKFQDYVALLRKAGIELSAGAVLQADNDTVFRSKAFTAWCDEQGIFQQFSAPHTQAQNGVAERAWCTLVDCARAMMVAAGVPKSMWGLALVHAAMVRNCVPTSAKGGAVPFELLFHSKPDLSFLRRFGCPAFVHVEPLARAKWDPKAAEGMYVGYNLNSKTYRIYMPATKTIKDSMHVDFNESPAAAVEGVKDDDRATATAVPDFGDEAGDSADAEDDDERGAGTADIAVDGGDAAAGPADDADDADAPIARRTRSRTAGALAALSNLDDDDGEDPALEKATIMMVNALIAHASPSDPANLREAMASPDCQQWKAAVLEECGSILENNTWTLIPRAELPPGMKAMGSRFVFKTKLNSDGGVERYKARLVIQGFTQREGIDYDEVFAPVAHHETIRVMLSIAASSSLPVHAMDVVTAFLVPTVDEELYMELPEGWPAELPGERKQSVCRLNKALYGLKQAPRYWNRRLNDWMLRQGFQRSQCDSCLYIKTAGDGAMVYVTVWVDDLLICGTTLEDVVAFKQSISSEFKMKDLGPVHFCLGMRIRQDQNGIAIDQERYSLAVLKRFNMDQCNPVGTPLVPGTELKPAKPPGAASSGGATETSAAEDPLLTGEDITRFREVVGSMMYLTICSRPDLAVAVNQLARNMATPAASHLAAAKHVLRYLRGTVGLGLHFKRASDQPANVVHGYADATWANVPESSRSVSGYAFFLNGAAVSWSCKVQKLVSLSTAEAEFVSLCEGVREALYLRNLLEEMGLQQPGPTIIYEDNQPCIHMARNPTTSGRTKHIAMRFNFVREQVEANIINVVYCPTQDMVADALTKVLPKPQHAHLRAQLLGLQE